MRPFCESETYSEPSGPTARPTGRYCALRGLLSVSSPAKPSAKTSYSPARLAVFHGLEHDLVSGLRFRRAIPAPVESNESAVLVLRGKVLARVEQQVVGRPVRRVGHERIRILARLRLLLRIAAVFGRDHALAELGIEERVRPAVIAAVDDLVEFLGLTSGVVLGLVAAPGTAYRGSRGHE